MGGTETSTYRECHSNFRDNCIHTSKRMQQDTHPVRRATQGRSQAEAEDDMRVALSLAQVRQSCLHSAARSSSKVKSGHT